MLAVRAFCFLFPLVWLSLATPIAKPGCQPSCGNISIPYPYGIGSSKDGDACFLNEFYNISCVETADHPPKAFLKGKNIEILNISINGQILVKSFVATAFYKKGQVVNSTSVEDEADISSYPMVYSYTENKLITIGCDDYAVLGRVSASESALTGGCIAGCEDLSVVVNGSCSGVGCCQTSIPIALFKYNLMLGSLKNHTTVDKRNPYGYAFIGKPSKFNFTVADLGDPDFAKRTRDTVPVVIDWFVRYDTFSSAYPTVSYNDFTNHINIKCHDYKPCHGGCGQQCSCLPGYQGNPYLRPGCTDIDECTNISSTHCSHICINTEGGYKCSCPRGYHGDGWKNGTRCVNSFPKVAVYICAVLGLLLLPPVGWWLYFMNKKRKVVKQKAKNFKKNGGLLMRRRMSSDERLMERAYFFTIDELETATDHFNESRILGRGGQGIVYKGMLGEGRLVAVKKSTTLNESQQEDFINEVVIMSQVIHRSIVRLLGFCLDSVADLGCSGTVGLGSSGTTGLGSSGIVGFGSSGIVGLGSSGMVGFGNSGILGFNSSSKWGLGISGTTGLGCCGSVGLGDSCSVGLGISTDLGFGSSGTDSLGNSCSVGLGSSGKVGFGISGTEGLGNSGNVGLGNSCSIGFGASSNLGFGISGCFGLGASCAVGLGSSGKVGFGSSGRVGLGSSGKTGFGSSGTVGLGSSGKVGFGSSGTSGFGISVLGCSGKESSRRRRATTGVVPVLITQAKSSIPNINKREPMVSRSKRKQV